MYEQLSLPICQSASDTVSVFRVRLSQLLESDEVSKTQEALFSLKSCDLLKSDTLQYYSPKTLQDFSITKKDAPSKSSSKRWQSWGILSNGKCLTAKISECHKTGEGSSLLDILEKEVDEKYFLSQIAVDRLLSYKDTKIEKE